MASSSIPTLYLTSLCLCHLRTFTIFFLQLRLLLNLTQIVDWPVILTHPSSNMLPSSLLRATILVLLNILLQVNSRRAATVSLAKCQHTRSLNILSMLSLNTLKLARRMGNVFPMSSMWIWTASNPFIILRLVFNIHLVMGMADMMELNVPCLRTHKAGKFSVMFCRLVVSVICCYILICVHVILGKGLKLCSAWPHDDVSHHLVSRTTITVADHSYVSQLTSESTAEKEVFLKTLSFFCALKETGCHVTSEDVNCVEDNYTASDSVDAGLTCDQYMDNIDFVLDNSALRSSCRSSAKRCQAKLLMEIDVYNQPFIQWVSSLYFVFNS